MSELNQNTEEIQQNGAGNVTNVSESNSETHDATTPVTESTETVVETVAETVTESANANGDQNNQNTNDTENEDTSTQSSSEGEKPTFEVDDESESESEEDCELDLSKYTVLDADNLDEDEPIPGQEYALFSFMSPEGIMNCNIRAFKFRGAFPTLEKAKKFAENLKKKDKYFKIHCGESGKWVEFDPPEDHVEQVVAGNKKQQKIIDAQRKARMDKMNELAGRHKQKMDKTDRGAKTRIEESKKAGAAEEYANKKRSKTQARRDAKQQKMQKQYANSRSARNEAMRERLRKKIEAKKAEKAEKANKNRLRNMRGDVEERSVTTEDRFGAGQVDNNDLQRKTEVVNKASEDLETKKSELERTNANIDKIRRMLQK